MTKIPKEIYSMTEAAEFFGIAVPTLKQKLRTGEWNIPEVRIGKLIKFHKQDLDSFVEANKGSHAEHKKAAYG